jgi:hypothetical protein
MSASVGRNIRRDPGGSVEARTGLIGTPGAAAPPPRPSPAPREREQRALPLAGEGWEGGHQPLRCDARRSYTRVDSQIASFDPALIAALSSG